MAKQQKLPGAGGFIASAMERTTSSAADGGPKGLPKERITFTMDAGSCEPGVFEEDFEITLEGLTSAKELQAAQKAKGDPTVLAFNLAQMSLYAVQGEPLRTHEREWLWEVIGPRGRSIVLGQFTKIGAPSDDAQGKAESTARHE